GVAAQIDGDAHARAVGLVAQLADALNLLVANKLGDALDEARLVHLVGDLVDDDLRLAGALIVLDARLAADLDAAAPRLVGAGDAGATADDAAREEIGTGHEL